MVEIKADGKWECHAVWFVPGAGRDWMGMVWRPDPTEPWRFTYRTRVYRDEKVFGSEDEKVVSQFVTNGEPVAEIEQIMDAAARLFAVVYSGPVKKVLVQGDGMHTLFMLGQQDWCHMQSAVVGQPEGGR